MENERIIVVRYTKVTEKKKHRNMREWQETRLIYGSKIVLSEIMNLKIQTKNNAKVIVE